MLVLSRKIGEVITVGNSVKVTVLSFDRGIVRLGIEAPKSIPVHRKEVHDKIIEMNKQASRTKLSALKRVLSNGRMAFATNENKPNSDTTELVLTNGTKTKSVTKKTTK